MKRIVIGIVVLTVLLVSIVPSTAAGPEPPIGEPNCVQVYPWSELCGGRVGSFTCHFLAGLPDEVCALSLR